MNYAPVKGKPRKIPAVIIVDQQNLCIMFKYLLGSKKKKKVKGVSMPQQPVLHSSKLELSNRFLIVR